jgi:hypothetical protein
MLSNKGHQNVSSLKKPLTQKATLEGSTPANLVPEAQSCHTKTEN